MSLTARDYWNLREELTIENGLVLKGDLLVIPEFLNIKHKVRLWRERCVLRAPKSAYWPVISSSKGIVNQVDQCRPTQKYQKEKKQKRAYTTAKTAKPTVGKLSDLFEFKGQQYLLLKDQYSRFPVIRRLKSTVINHPKNIFAEHSISMKLMTDNGP